MPSQGSGPFSCQNGPTRWQPGPSATAPAALIALAALPYLNTLLNGFVNDDHTQITDNPYLRNFHHLRAIFTTSAWSYLGPHSATNYFRPLMTLGYAACYRAFGPMAYGYHLVSLSLHAAATLLVFAIAQRITGNRAWAFIAGALFAIHPVHTESVAWIAAVTDVELTVFTLLAFYLFVSLSRFGSPTHAISAIGKPVAKPRRRLAIVTAGMLAAYALALLSKEQALMLPPLATLYEHLCRDDRSRTSVGEKLARYGPLWLVAAGYMLWRVHFMGAFAPVRQMASLTPKETALSALALIGSYAGKLIWPARLCAFYIFHASTSLTDPRVASGLAVLSLLALLFFALARRPEPNLRFAAFGIAWFLLTLVPVLNAHWMAANVFAERYLYLPSVGFCWLAGGAFSEVWRRTAQRPQWRSAVLAGGLTLTALATLRIVTRNRDWRDDVTLYTRTLAQSPGAYPVLNNLGTVYWQEGRVDQAEAVWRRALAASPRSAIVLNNLGLVAGWRNRYPDAVALFNRAIALKPSYPDPHLNLGIAERALGERQAAENDLRRAVALSPLSERAHLELGELLLDEGRLGEAGQQFRASLQSQPTAPAYDDLGQAELREDQVYAAARAFRAALNLDPFDSRAHFALAGIYADAGRKREALGQYRAGLFTDPRNGVALAAVRSLEAPHRGSPGEH
jgi:protein O-mannosyl-transferase